MEIINTIAALRQRLDACRKAGKSIGFVPTMGYLHKGHLTLVEQAETENAVTVVSIFVNPLQFGKGEDLEKYPRDLARDSAMLEAASVDFLFAPGVADMYPRPIQTVVDLPELGGELEGKARPGHFAGVATVVTKLFNIVQPDAAYFGEKDYQQVAIIRRMVEDLAMPVRVVPVATVREADGLACSSRNVYLTEEQRAASAIVPKALEEAERLYRNGLRDAAEMEAALAAFIAREPLARPDVVAVRHPDTLATLPHLDQPFLVLLYVQIGTTKLLDNRVIDIESKKEAAE
ncbi:pantoate--beta-alanine ligase [Agrobacterium vitis]|uniref:Pantothenate synthetase n=1 Tax=Agrobacterium vitis TaxID=373 RepID=A0ABD6GH99_AGRVI|nr:pantoate--beta-alanine ligase [Agrobacterium vitis]MUO82004.1 pantoate--beta-alanine ligase [Agrobacterium vitis]MUO96983.1 pantoate--beta-alanine ligase [Agrobacterium vitis]MUP08224.1 pantoate--beta-alanine ligase [Agrobacterium vitis]MUZ80690.1 pantoate--beta-alanine ligase [Agrobacterium vitis]MVA09174.1 pantoate--beta-alanine ligase [Agrobacterium vitis]